MYDNIGLVSAYPVKCRVNSALRHGQRCAHAHYLHGGVHYTRSILPCYSSNGGYIVAKVDGSWKRNVDPAP